MRKAVESLDDEEKEEVDDVIFGVVEEFSLRDEDGCEMVDVGFAALKEH